MYLKLMVRSLARHQKRGRRLFILLALCSAALVVLLTFQADFARQYRDLFIGIKTGHLQILPKDSPAFAVNTFGARDQEVATLRVAPALDNWVRSQPEVEESAPVIERYGMAYNLDSETESWVSLVAIPADRRAKLLPLARVLEGQGDLAWSSGDAEVPVLRSRLQTEFGERNADFTLFLRKELKAGNEAQLNGFKYRLKNDFPGIFSGNLAGSANDQAFLDAWSASLIQKELYQSIPPARLETYDYRIDDAVVALQENTVEALVPFFNKRLFQALYPDDIYHVAEPVVVGKSVTLQVPGLKPEGALSLPKIIPARYSGLVDIMPLYTPDSYIDLTAFRHYMDAPDDRATGYIIRLKDIETSPAFQKRLEGWLATHGNAEGVTDVRVTDYQFLGKYYLTTALAFGVVIGILIGVFVLILVIFIVNLVLMSLIQRRREIGTGIAMGLSTGQTIGVMTGEIAVIVTVSWLAGSIVAALVTTAAGVWGIPGMIFFPGGNLKLTQQLWPHFLSYLILLPSAVLAALVPLSGLRKLLPVDFFREAR